MSEFYFDLRNGDLKVLVKEGNKILHTTFVENILITPDKLKDVFNEVKKTTGHYPNAINLILPDEEFIIKEMLLPKISEEETNKLIRKRLESEFKAKEFTFFHYFLREEENGRVFLIQAIKGEKIQYYVKLFKNYGIKVERITSGLILNIRIAEELSQKDDKLKIFVEIERNTMEIFGMINNNIIKYQRYNLPKIDKNELNDNEISEERLVKKQIYLITDYIYNFNLSLKQELIDVVCDIFLIFGAGLNIYDGLENALKEALPQNIEILAENLKMKKDFSAYVSLYYYSELKREKVFDFLIKESYKEIFFKSIRPKTLVILLILVSLSEVFLLEYLNVSYRRKVVSKKNELEVEIKNLKNIEQEKEMEQRIKLSRVNLYYIFKELSNRLPDDIYIEKLVYTRNEVQKKNILELSYNVFIRKDLSKHKYLSNIRDIFNNITWVRISGEPNILSKTEDKKDFLNIKINYELENNVK